MDHSCTHPFTHCLLLCSDRVVHLWQKPHMALISHISVHYKSQCVVTTQQYCVSHVLSWCDILCNFYHQWIPTKSKKGKAKVDFRWYAFQAQWSVDYFIIELDRKSVCSLCNDTTAIEYILCDDITVPSIHQNVPVHKKAIVQRIRKF